MHHKLEDMTDLISCRRTDIEQEVNGVYSFDREAKIDPAKLKDIFDQGARTYLERHKSGSAVLSSSVSPESALPTGVAKPS